MRLRLWRNPNLTRKVRRGGAVSWQHCGARYSSGHFLHAESALGEQFHSATVGAELCRGPAPLRSVSPLPSQLHSMCVPRQPVGPATVRVGGLPEGLRSAARACLWSVAGPSASSGACTARCCAGSGGGGRGRFAAPHPS